MKFAVPLLAASLAQVAYVSAAPVADGNKPAYWFNSRRLRAPWLRKPSYSPPPAASPAAPVVSSAVPSSAPSSVPYVPVPEPSPEPEPAPAPVPSVVVPEKPVQSVPVPQPSTPAQPAPSPSPPPSYSSGPTSGGKALIDSANDYRRKAGLPLFTWDDKLAQNAAKTGADAGGKALVHQLNSGSMGQVLVYGTDDADKCTRDFGSYTPFEVYYLSWLCERPDDPALGGVCQDIFNKGRIDNQGQTGHHDLLANANYKKIGCAFSRDPSAAKCAWFPGVWACDLA